MKTKIQLLLILFMSVALLFHCSPKEREHLNPFDPEYVAPSNGGGGGGGGGTTPTTGLQPREGTTMWRITIKAPGGWYGWGIDFWDRVANAEKPTDISSYNNLVFSIASSNAQLTDLQVGLVSSGGVEVWVNVSTYGYVNDGKWHDISIPLATFQAGGVDLTKVTYVFANKQATGIVPVGARFYLDNIYLDGPTTDKGIYHDSLGKIVGTEAELWVWPQGETVDIEELTK